VVLSFRPLLGVVGVLAVVALVVLLDDPQPAATMSAEHAISVDRPRFIGAFTLA
jgi:hypothetical protein